mmetsp:Transcript_80686/g.261511  ORF Transcript_80686/g.261511 Transcript_80686/m.261511 type:complete len:281 (-) Transcript_80686:1346-2188(-)
MPPALPPHASPDHNRRARGHHSRHVGGNGGGHAGSLRVDGGALVVDGVHTSAGPHRRSDARGRGQTAADWAQAPVGRARAGRADGRVRIAHMNHPVVGEHLLWRDSRGGANSRLHHWASWRWPSKAHEDWRTWRSDARRNSAARRCNNAGTVSAGLEWRNLQVGGIRRSWCCLPPMPCDRRSRPHGASGSATAAAGVHAGRGGGRRDGGSGIDGGGGVAEARRGSGGGCSCAVARRSAGKRHSARHATPAAAIKRWRRRQLQGLRRGERAEALLAGRGRR